MLSLFKLINVLDRQMAPLEIQQDMCSRLISTVSGCTRCTDNCPSDSISITENEIQVRDCIQCGVCTTVCPTGALTWKRLSPKNIFADVEHLRSTEENLYIYCAHTSFPVKKAMGLQIPCLAAIPWEIWTALQQSFPSLKIYLQNESCQKCPVTTGEKVWKQQVTRAEAVCQKQISICQELKQSDAHVSFDPSRRQFFHSVFREMKQTNREVVKEYLSSPKPTGLPAAQSHTGEETIVEEITKELSQTKHALLARMNQESRFSYVEKRKLLLQQLKRDEEFQQRVTVKLPVINQGCDVCGACTALCPTTAIEKVETNGEISIQLHAAKCVDCGLCIDVCWEKHISMREQNIGALLQDEPVKLCEIFTETNFGKSNLQRSSPIPVKS